MNKRVDISTLLHCIIIVILLCDIYFYQLIEIKFTLFSFDNVACKMNTFVKN